MSDSYLRSVRLFESFDDKQLETLDRILVLQSYGRGHVFMREGDATTSMNSALFVIVEGDVDVASRRPDGGFAVDKTVGAGSILGMIGLLDHEKRSATLTAATAVKAAHLSRHAFMEMYWSKADLAAKFQFALAQQLVRDIRNLDNMLRDAVLSGDDASIRERFDHSGADK
ncbi:MAG: CRP-like cAMP-binding protein [Myxococcota bacterium]|jgi:CRP-like cAMP-binding protein